MEESQLIIFFFFASFVCLILISGIVIFIIQYRKRKLEYNTDKALLNKTHQEELLKTQIDIQMQTLKDIGREIHDNVGQKLTLASIYTSQLAHANFHPDIQTQLHSIGEIINDSLTELRSLSKSITNEAIDSAELFTIIKNECAKVNALQICQVNFIETEEPFVVSAVQKNFIQRILQEFIHNSLKHASCKTINVEMNYHASNLQIQLSDDGIGFDMQQNSEGIGLNNMKSRADLLNADYSMISELGKGTYCKITLPLNKAA